MRGLEPFQAGSEEGAEKVDVRELYRTQLLTGIGGWQGMLVAGLPTIVFVVVNALTRLWPAIIAAVATAAVLTVYRLIRKQSVQQALSGLFGVLIAALIAARTGQARGYFLFGIWQSFVYAVPFVISVLVRRPLVGLVYEFLDPAPGDEDVPWYRRRGLRGAYTIATVIGAVLFLSRGIVQAILYHRNDVGWLTVVKIAMGYPLFIVAVAAGWWVIRRARLRAAPADAATVEPASADDGGVERGLGLG